MKEFSKYLHLIEYENELRLHLSRFPEPPVGLFQSSSIKVTLTSWDPAR